MRARLSAAAIATVALVLGAAAPAAAVPVTELKPAQLDRGGDIAVPHLEGKTIVDGDVRIRIRAGAVRFLGTSGADYVVGLSNKSGIDNFRTVRVTPEGDRTLLFRDRPIWDLVLSDDGSQIASSTLGRERSRVRVFSATDGEREAALWLRGSVSVLDFDSGQMVLGGWSPDRTLVWQLDGNVLEKILGRAGYAADLGADRVATYTKDPYRGGCSIVTTLAAPRERLWKSCDERVDGFAPEGSRMATIHILADGLGPNHVWLRKAGGKLLAHYTATWFGRLWWESDTSLLLDTNGTDKAATVRCQVAECERATDLRPVPNYRHSAWHQGS